MDTEQLAKYVLRTLEQSSEAGRLAIPSEGSKLLLASATSELIRDLLLRAKELASVDNSEILPHHLEAALDEMLK
ncbi:hypothetical protein J7295_00131 [Nakaseomyces glabratus]|nr:hypothetical protein J7298_00125 [Nakaseomyces glabratus]KAH7609759.1 hypothetical protein J7295_00131 [Nakaseomyces glabratus]KAH7615467.1 hypothetical protein J7292_00127 [Nakaseomyces glabratus]